MNSTQRKLYRRRETGRIAGICSGLADYLDVDVTLVRVAWVVLAIIPGGVIGGILAYLAAWLVIPESTELSQSGDLVKRMTRSTSDRKLAGVCGGIGEYLQIDSAVVRLAWIVLTIVPGAIVFGVTAYLIAWFIMPAARGDSLSPAAQAPSAA